MARRISRTPDVQSPQDLLRDIFSPNLLPDESAESYEALRAALFSDLSPEAPYEHLLADQLVALEWDVLRHRRLRDSLLRAEFREQAVGVFYEGSVGRVNDAYSATGSRNSAAQLVSRDPGTRETALSELSARQITPEEIMAKACQAIARDLEPHDNQIAEIEARRRRLREDYDRVKASRARPIDDADEIGE